MSEASGTSRFDVGLIHRAASLYYLDDATQAQIAEQLDVSRPTVSRLLSEGRRLGIVEIRVHDPLGGPGNLDERLRDALGIQEVRLAPYTGPDVGRSLVEPVGAMLRGANLVPGDTLLVSSGRTLFELSRQKGLPRITGLKIAPTVGGVSEPQPWYQTNEIIRAWAERLGGRPYFLFAQALPSAVMRETLDQDASFREVTGLWDGAKAAVVGIGAPPSVRSSISASIPRGTGELASAVGDICLNFFDPSGTELTFPGAERMVRTPPELLRRIPFVLGVAVGEEKVHSIIAGARAHLFNRLVTDSPTAELILSELESQR